MASPYDAPLPFYNRVVMSNETFVDQFDQVKTARDQIKTAHPAALAQSNAEALAEVLRLICWIRSTEYLIPLNQFDVCASVIPHNGPTGCPNTADEPTARLSATELHTIKILYYVSVTNKWVIVKESACSHPDPWQTMKCLVFELRKEFQQHAGWGAEPVQVPITRRHKKATRRPKSRKAQASSQKVNEPSQKVNEAKQNVGESNSRPVNPAFRSDLTHRKDSLMLGSSWRNIKSIKHLWRDDR